MRKLVGVISGGYTDAAPVLCLSTNSTALFSGIRRVSICKVIPYGILNFFEQQTQATDEKRSVNVTPSD